MKKIISVILVLAMLFAVSVSFAGCEDGMNIAIPETNKNGEQGLKGEKGE